MMSSTEVYSEVVGAETSRRHRVTGLQLRHTLEEARTVASGVGLPAVFFVVAAVGGAIIAVKALLH